MADLRIDIISDVVCPWCYLGYSRLKQAIEQLGDDYRIDIRWQPFELHPDMPLSGADRETYLGERFGSPEKRHTLYSKLVLKQVFSSIFQKKTEFQTPNLLINLCLLRQKRI